MGKNIFKALSITALTVFVILPIAIVLFFATILLLWDIGYEAREKTLYSDLSNFETVTEEFVSIDGNGPDYTLHVRIISDEDYYGEDEYFHINVSNYAALEEAGYKDKLVEGMPVTFTTCTRIIGDGYHEFPVIYLEADGEVLLDTETGHKNLMNAYWWIFWR